MKKLVLFLLVLIPITVNGIDISARSAILMDMDSNRILYEKNIHEIRSVASISKIMTAVIAIESGKLDDKVTIGDEIKKAYGSGIYIQVGEEMTLRDLLYGFMLKYFLNPYEASMHIISKLIFFSVFFRINLKELISNKIQIKTQR